MTLQIPETKKCEKIEDIRFFLKQTGFTWYECL